MSFRLRIARRLMAHACAVMPSARSDWAEAMRAEFAGIADESEALRWACGCVWACYVERLDPRALFLKSLVRAGAVSLVNVAGFAVPTIMNPHKYLTAFHMLQAARKLSIYFAAIFVALWIGEILIARFWSAPNRIVAKSFVRAAAVWLWPLSIVLIWRLIKMPELAREHHFHPHLARFLWGAAVWLPSIYVAILIPLLICEFALARHARTKLAS